jgi:FkbM family methyltransferase
MRLFAEADVPVLVALLRDAGIKVVDIGGRGKAFRPCLPLAAFTDYYVAEADVQEAARLQKALPESAPWRSVTVITDAIASRCGAATLYMTAAAGMSSLLEPDLTIARRFCLGAKFEVFSTTPVQTMALDDAASRYGFSDATFLKLDTQGTELDILDSGKRLLDDSLIGVHTEVLFHPFYRGQALFGDVDAHLRRHGFSLFSLNRTLLRRSSYRKDAYSRRMIAWAHCLYFRDPETLIAWDADSARRRLAALLGFALVFEHHDFACEIVETMCRAALLPSTERARLVEEVRWVCDQQTSRALRWAEAQGMSREMLLAPVVRDKSRRD